MYRRLPPALSLHQAMEEAPSLARLAHQVAQSRALFEGVQGHIPPTLRSQVMPGPLDGGDWCLLVTSNAAAAKLRQLLPLMRQALRQQGWPVEQVRVKILGGR